MFNILEFIDSFIIFIGYYIILEASFTKLFFRDKVTCDISLNYYNRIKIQNFGYHIVPLKVSVSYNYNGMNYDKEIFILVDRRKLENSNKLRCELLILNLNPDKCVQNFKYSTVVVQGIFFVIFGYSLLGILYGG